jgi:hypothetical protein
MTLFFSLHYILFVYDNNSLFKNLFQIATAYLTQLPVDMRAVATSPLPLVTLSRYYLLFPYFQNLFKVI